MAISRPDKRALPPWLRAALEDWARLVWILLALAFVFATLKGQLARAAEFPSDIGAGTLLFQARDGGFDSAAPLATDLRISVAGIVARVAVAQRFRNASTDWLEAVYVLPLPEDAAVDRMTMRIGDRLIEGEIHEREQAERIYSEARDSGQQASLVRQTSANLFTTVVANIAPGDSIDITIEYLQTARFDAGEFSLRVPMTLTPRYGAPDTPEARSAISSSLSSGVIAATQVRVPAAAALLPPSVPSASGTPVHEASVHAVIAPGVAVSEIGGRGHTLRVTHEPETGRYRLDTLDSRVPMDRDLVIAWRPEVGAKPVLAALSETRGDTTYALLMLLPPASATNTPIARPREQIFVVDTSGSMGGQSIEQAKAALGDALGRLRSADRFNVLEFNSQTSSLFRTPVPFTQENYTKALRYVDSLHATGGTEIETAIRTALALPSTAGYLRQVVFITDGAVGGETRLFSAIKQNLGDARLFTIGIGSAPNANFMRKAAQFGRGTFTYIGDTAEVGSSMQALFEKLERVAMTDIIVDWPEAAEFYPNQVPDLYAGEPLVVAASFPARANRAAHAEVWGVGGGARWSQSVDVRPSELPGIAALWARRKIEYLVDSRVDGLAESLIRTLVIQTALEHHLVSPYTSLVAVDQTPARSAAAAQRRQAVANNAPAGAEWSVALPRTGTSAPFYRWLGTLSWLLAGALLVLGGSRWRARASAVSR